MLLRPSRSPLSAEWGDFFQIATIAMAADGDVGVTVGGCIGHGLCAGVAVVDDAVAARDAHLLADGAPRAKRASLSSSRSSTVLEIEKGT